MVKKKKKKESVFKFNKKGEMISISERFVFENKMKILPQLFSEEFKTAIGNGDFKNHPNRWGKVYCNYLDFTSELIDNCLDSDFLGEDTPLHCDL